MKMDRALINSRKKAIIIKARGRAWEMPFSKLALKPSPQNPIVSVEVDPETGGHCFTYKLKDGQEDTVPGDALLDIYGDPDYLKKLHLHNLTVTALKALSRSKISKRSLARRLNTSPKQLYRLLDTAFHGKTIDQMIRLLNALDVDVEIKTSPRKKAA